MDYEIIRSRRQTVVIHVNNDRSVQVRCPLDYTDEDVARIVWMKEPWILSRLASLPPLNPMTNEELDALTRQAKAWFPQRVAFWAEKLGLTYGRIAIRHQRSCWGSCSTLRNLNFNCLLMLVPEETADYVIVHELCHLVHLNHSKAFWALVESAIPDYAIHRRWLKAHSLELLGRLPQKS